MKLARILTIAFALMAVTVCLHAQERQFAIAKVPFPFTVHDTYLPAGTYVVSTRSPFSMIKIRNTSGIEFATVQIIPSDGANISRDTKLVFQILDGHYFLSQIWEAGSSVRRDIRPGKVALELAKNQNKSTVAVVAHAGTSQR